MEEIRVTSDEDESRLGEISEIKRTLYIKISCMLDRISRLDEEKRLILFGGDIEPTTN